MSLAVTASPWQGPLPCRVPGAGCWALRVLGAVVGISRSRFRALSLVVLVLDSFGPHADLREGHPGLHHGDHGKVADLPRV